MKKSILPKDVDKNTFDLITLVLSTIDTISKTANKNNISDFTVEFDDIYVEDEEHFKLIKKVNKLDSDFAVAIQYKDLSKAFTRNRMVIKNIIDDVVDKIIDLEFKNKTYYNNSTFVITNVLSYVDKKSNIQKHSIYLMLKSKPFEEEI